MKRLLAALCLLGAFGASSCNIVGPVIAIAQGPPTEDAVYKLQPERPTVIFVDDRLSYLPRRSLRSVIASSAGKLLAEHGVLKVIIDPSSAIGAIAGEQNTRPVPLVTLTKSIKSDSVQAEVMIYATVESFRLTSDGQTFEPTGSLRVKVIDTKAPQPRVWPEEPEGKTITVKLPVPAGATPKSSAELTKSEDALGEELGRSLAELFYEHETVRSLSENR